MFLFLAALAVSLAVSIVTEILKKWKGIGSTGTQLIVFGFAIVIAMLQYGWQFVPVQYAEAILTVVSGAIAWYELVVKKLEKS